MSNTIPSGYKMTDIGVIPEDWEVTRLGDLLEFRNGVNADKDNYGKGVPFINVLEVITKSHLYTSDIPGRVSLTKNLITSFSVQHGDIVFNRTSETQEDLGLASVYLGNDVIVFGGFVIRGRPLKQSIDAIYAGYFLRAPIVRFQITAKGQGAIRANIGQGDLRKVLVPLPPTLTEQRAIAEALSDVDEQITALDEAIIKKRDIKQGAMQRLLTGEERLPGFSGEWIETIFEEVMTGFSSGMTPSRRIPDYYTGDIPWITSSELNYDIITDTKEKITREAVVKTNLQILPVGTFLIAITGLEAEGTRGRCGIVGVEATTNQSCMALFPKEGLLTEYLFYYYIMNGDALAFGYCQGTKQQSYTGKIAKILPINLPPSEDEQQAIVNVLSDMDAEISALEAEHEKTVALKQGMMQELLTGKTRLV